MDLIEWAMDDRRQAAAETTITTAVPALRTALVFEA